MSASQVIANYELMTELSRQMRAAAIDGDWDRVIAIEQERGKLVDVMKPLDASVKLDARARERKNQLISQALADDIEIRNLIQAWKDQVELEMKSNLQEQRLRRAYGV